MDINLKVSPAELEAKATDFKGVMSQIKTLTDDMMADVTGLSSTSAHSIICSSESLYLSAFLFDFLIPQ